MRVTAAVAVLLSILGQGAEGFMVPASTARSTSLRMSMDGPESRRGMATKSLGVLTSLVAAKAAFAEEEAGGATTLGAAPTDWGLTNEYYKDAPRVVTHMRYATSMPKGTPDYEKIATNCKKEMIDFVSFYRRFPNIAGKPSFSTMYTAINVLAGHYTNYGVKFPVPEKRKKRLIQEYAEIEKNLKRSR